MKRISTTRANLFVAGAFLLASCIGSESPVAPERAMRPKMPAPRLVTVLAGKTLTFWEGGSAYTLDVTNQKVIFGNGQQLLLDADVTAEIATAFQAILESEAFGPALEDVACTAHPEMCVDPYFLGGAKSRPNGVSWFGPEGANGQSGLGVRIISSGKPQTGDVAITSTDMCGDIAGAILQTSSDWRSRKTSFASGLLDAAAIVGVGVTLGPAAAAMVALRTRIADVYAARVDMGLLGTLWNSYSCDNRNVTATGMQIVGGFDTSDGLYKLVCEWTTGYITIGGSTREVEIKLCEYQKVQ